MLLAGDFTEPWLRHGIEGDLFLFCTFFILFFWYGILKDGALPCKNNNFNVLIEIVCVIMGS
jgi:hypothetical protein